MTFLYPLGFLGLIAVPVLIIIYIIKNKYTEQVVSSTYLWTLSEKFLKRKNPISRINGLISLILQILAVVAVSIAIAHPVFVIPDHAGDYCFILDGTGSMNIMQTDRSRLDIGKEQIRSVIEDSANGSAYTLIFVGNSTDIVYEGITDRDRALTRLDELSPTYGAVGMTDALGAVQEYFNQTPSLKIYLVTDKDYETTQNVEVINVSDHEQNYALSDVEYTLTGGKLVVSGSAISYESAATVEIGLYIDGSEIAQSSLTLELVNLEQTEFSFETDDVAFESLEVRIENADALAEDNGYIIYNVRYDSSFTTLIVSDRPFFIQASLVSLGNSRIETVSTADYVESSGYGLYIFDSFTPSTMPRDGAVWFINPDGSVDNSGFSVQDEVVLSGSGKLVYNSSTATAVRTLLDGLTKSDIYIAKYVKCGLYRSFTTLLSYDGSPVLFAGSNVYGNREVVFAFDFHGADFVITPDFMLLMDNLIGYTFPEVVSGSSYSCGDIIEINLPANCESVRLETPSGGVEYLGTDAAIAEYQLTEVGVYTVTLGLGGVTRSVNIFSAMPLSERETTAVAQSFEVTGEPSNALRDGRYDNLIYIFITLAVLFIADWMVYCYEQYQLR